MGCSKEVCEEVGRRRYGVAKNSCRWQRSTCAAGTQRAGGAPAGHAPSSICRSAAQQGSVSGRVLRVRRVIAFLEGWAHRQRDDEDKVTKSQSHNHIQRHNSLWAYSFNIEYSVRPSAASTQNVTPFPAESDQVPKEWYLPTGDTLDSTCPDVHMHMYTQMHMHMHLASMLNSDSIIGGPDVCQFL